MMRPRRSPIIFTLSVTEAETRLKDPLPGNASVTKGDGLRAKDNRGDGSAGEILLVSETVIHGQDDVKTGGFRVPRPEALRS